LLHKSLGVRMTPMSLVDDLLNRCHQLARHSEEPGRITRTFLSPQMKDVHRDVSQWMTSAGMNVRVDAIGNIIGRYEAPTHDAKVLLIGSHLDTVPNAGKYDGILGVLAGVSLIESLNGRKLPFHIDVVGFSEEEGVRFSTPYLGSKAIAGQLDDSLLNLLDRNDKSVADVIRDFNLDPSHIPHARYDPASLIGYVEVHIEQGPVLEKLGRPLAIVQTIAGQSRLRFEIMGRADHAGTAPMALRHDALAGAAEIILATESAALSLMDLVATVGYVAVSPNASNVVPGEVHLSLDLRHARDEVRDSVLSELIETAREIAMNRRLKFHIESALHHSAVPMDPHLTELLWRAAGGTAHHMTSGAGHDAAIMASVCPAAMLFIRSPGGISHHPDEAVLPGDVAAALDVLGRFLDLVVDDYNAQPRSSA
jgi:allantoate deiminase